jgi:DNA-binding beta-propeller fold protein YncE
VCPSHGAYTDVSTVGTKLYVAAFGSSKVGVFDTATLEDDSFDPTLQSAQYIDVSGGGPGGVVLDEARDRLYVLTRFDNSVSVVDLSTGNETAHVALFNPEPPEVVDGRPFLYDAVATSSNGEASCGGCHVFGDNDQLAWDLGNPDDEATSSPMTI